VLSKEAWAEPTWQRRSEWPAALTLGGHDLHVEIPQ